MKNSACSHYAFTKACSKCRVELPTHMYQKQTSAKSGLTSACKDCLVSAPNRLFQILAASAKTRQTKWNQEKSIKSCTFDLDTGFLRVLLSNQGGRCFYSGVTLSQMSLSHWQMSLERLNPNIGYRKDNVALVALELNSRAQMTLRKMSQIPHLIASEPNITFQQLNEVTDKFTRKTNVKYNKKLEKGNAFYCYSCFIWQLKYHFTHHRTQCDTCRRKRMREYHYYYSITLKGFLRALLRNAKQSANKRFAVG
eukprot:786266_1